MWNGHWWGINTDVLASELGKDLMDICESAVLKFQRGEIIRRTSGGDTNINENIDFYIYGTINGKRVIDTWKVITRRSDGKKMW